MALTIGQTAAMSYAAVLAKQRKPENQWAESSALRALETEGLIERISFGRIIEVPLDYQRNPGAVIQSTELQPLSQAKTVFATSASWDFAEIAAPFNWSNRDETSNPTENQKFDFVASGLKNTLDTHDDLIEQALFATNTNGLFGLVTHVPTTGQGSDGGIDSAVNSFWRSQSATYTDDTDIEVTFQTVENACIKGSGSKMGPKLMMSDAPTWSLYAGTQAALQRWTSQDVKGGIKSLAFGNCKYIFSPYGTSTVYFIGKSFKLLVSKQSFREMSETIPFQNATGYTKRVYSALQTVVDNRSRIGCAHT